MAFFNLSRPALRSLLALLALAAACGGGPGPAAGSGPPSPAEDGPEGWLLYVPNQDDATISVIDTATREVVRTLDLRELGFGPNAKPHHVVAEPDGSYWYVSLIGENRVLKMDADHGLVAAAEFEAPGMLELDPEGDRLYVGRSMSAVNPPSRIGIIRRSDMSVEELDVVFPRPHALALAPGGQVLYTASLALNRFAAVRPALEEVELVDVEGPHHTLVQFAVSPDGRWMVGTGEMTGRMLVFDLSGPGGPSQVAEVAVGQRPWHPVFTPDGGHVYVGNKGSNTVSVVEVGSWTETAALRHEGLDLPHGSAVTPDGRWVFISSNGSDGAPGSVAVIDTSGPEVVDVVPVGRNAAGLGLRRAR